MNEHETDSRTAETLDRLTLALERLEVASGTADDRNPHVRRRRITRLMNDSDLSTAEEELRELLDEQWKVPENIYLLGVLFLLQGRYSAARAAIDRSLNIKPWLTEVPAWCGSLRECLTEAEQADRGWLWPRYRRRLDSFETYGMTLTSVLTSRFEHRDVQLVQVGANDGVNTDPMYGWIKKFEWRALLLEPMPESFGLLDVEHADRDRVITVNAAIADTDSRRTMWTHAGDRHAVSTFTPDRNLLRNEQNVRTVEVDCRSFGSLFDEYAIRTVDILQIDTEGFDYEILKMYDFERARPQVIHLEFYLLPIEERLRVFDLLDSQNYAWRMSGADLLAVDTETFAEQFGLIR